MSWELTLRAVVADHVDEAVEGSEVVDEGPDRPEPEISLPIPDVMHALVSGGDIEADGGSDDPSADAVVFGGDVMAGGRVVLRPNSVPAVYAWLAVHEAAELAAKHASPVAARIGGVPSAEIAEHIEALYEELRDFYAGAAQAQAYVLKWPE